MHLAICPNDGDALVETLRFPGAELFCVTCDGRFGWFDVPSTEWTAALQERLDEVQVEFDSRYGRAAS